MQFHVSIAHTDLQLRAINGTLFTYRNVISLHVDIIIYYVVTVIETEQKDFRLRL